MFLILFREYVRRCNIVPVIPPLTYKQWLDMVRQVQREDNLSDQDVINMIEEAYPAH